VGAMMVRYSSRSLIDGLMLKSPHFVAVKI
jgi:hypothetical protein